MPLTPKQNKTINRVLKELQVYFPKLDKKILTDTYKSKTFEEFLENTKNYTTGNILVTDGIADSISNAVIEANNFQMLKQRELVRQTIQQEAYNLVVDAGESLKKDLREMAKKGYDLGVGSKELGKMLVERDLEALYIFRGSEQKSMSESRWNSLSPEEKSKCTFNSQISVMSPQTRVKTIARTETKRAGTISNYIRAQERGKNKFKVSCRSDCCPLCAEIYQDLQDYKPTETKETILTDGVEYDMVADIDKLPPFHPNCRCSAEFYESTEEETNNSKLSEKELLKKNYDEILNYYGFKPDGNDFIKTHENGQKTKLHIDKDVVKNNGYKTVKLQDIVDEIGRADLKYTSEINLLNHNDDDLEDALGINKYNQPEIYNNPKYKELFPNKVTDEPNHRIYFNTKLFNEEKYNRPDKNFNYYWRFTIRHEIAHSADITKENFKDEVVGRSGKNDYQALINDSEDFTYYSRANPMEHFAEHGGYISTMLSHPELQEKTVRIVGGEKINFKQYKEKFKGIYEYFKEFI